MNGTLPPVPARHATFLHVLFLSESSPGAANSIHTTTLIRCLEHRPHVNKERKNIRTSAVCATHVLAISASSRTHAKMPHHWSRRLTQPIAPCSSDTCGPIGPTSNQFKPNRPITGEDVLRAGPRRPAGADGARDEAPLRGGGAHAQVGRDAHERGTPEALQ